MRSLNRNVSFNWSDIVTKAILVFVILCLGGAVISMGYLIFHPQLFGKLWTAMTYNMNFWFIMVAGVTYGLWRKYSNPQEFTWIELPVQLVIGFIVTVGCFGAFLFWSSGLQDSEIWNGRVSISEYYEEWTEEVTYTEEECTGSGENRSCRTVTKTRHDYHPPYWQLTTSNGEVVSISSGIYHQYVTLFGNEREEDLFHMNQVSFGDGDKYVTKWQGNTDAMVPTAVSHEYVNFLRASKSLQRRSGTTGPYAKYLLNYPTVTGGKYGQIEFHRVLTAGVTIPQQWRNAVDQQLDRVLASLGSQKQVNLVVYIVGTADRGFLHALEEHWVYGKKNDVVLILGMNQFPTVEWAGVMIFHGNETLRVKLRDAVETQADVSDPQAFASLFVRHIQQDFKRVPMAELEYLLHDIEIPWWAIIAVWIMVGMVVFVTSQYLENNQTRNSFRRFAR